jgi:hypothetical protein
MGPVKSKMSRKSSNDNVAQARQSKTKVEARQRDDATAIQSRNDTLLQDPAAAGTRARDEMPKRPSVREFMAYQRLQYTRLSVALSSNINFTLTASGEIVPAAVQEVFNIPELLEMILLYLRPNLLYSKVQLSCRGFKTSMESSPTFQRRLAIATTRGAPPNWPLLWSVQPRCMRFLYALTGRVAFKLTFKHLSFEKHLFKERFRQLAVSDTLPQRIEVLWYEKGQKLVPDIEPHATGFWLNLDQMIWMSSEVAAGRHERITFGRIFDEVARRVPTRGRVGGMVVIFTEDRHTFCGPEVGDADDEGYLRATSA